MLQIKKNLEEKSDFGENQSSNDEQTSMFNSRVKRNDGDGSLEKATAKGNYAYWLNQEDITDIARLQYNNYKRIGVSAEFEVLGSTSQLAHLIEKFKLKTQHLEVARLTLIINLANLHWVTLIISHGNEGYVSYYIDSKDNAPPTEYYALLNSLGISLISLKMDVSQQTDAYNCGLWALENAFTLNEMLDENWSLHQVINELKVPRNSEYFNNKRLFLSAKLRADAERNARWLHTVGSEQGDHLTSDSEPMLKRQRAETKEEKTRLLLEVFVEAFISAFMKRLAAYHLAAKGERLTDTTLKIELKTGLTGALLGVGISQSIVGSIPSLVASIRMLSAKYYLPKANAQKITRIFSLVPSGELSPILAEAAVSIFQNFESQFVQITDKAGDKVAMEKLAEDAVGRVLNYLTKYGENQLISKELIQKSLLLGPSEKFFDPNVKKVRLRISGNTVQDDKGKSINTANLYEKVGVVSVVDGAKKFYKLIDQQQSALYGYRQLFEWEQEENGELRRDIRDNYVEQQSFVSETTFQSDSRNHRYSSGTEIRQKAQAILNKIENRVSRISDRELISNLEKKSIFFDLRDPVANFVGRDQILNELHSTLLAGRTTAITSALSSLSLDTPDISLPGSGSQASVSGLGGIGKTQLVLRYAQLHATDYDNNVLWINAETQENLIYSFKTLATRLQLATKDRYDLEKNTEEIAQAIYAYFSDGKSLFIFDNVENYREIERFLPRSMPGNKPSLLITSRYSHWQNVASVISLDVFSEEESMVLVKKELNIVDNSQDLKIKELATLLHGLPLALQQALAYINLQKNINAGFNIHDYIELWKQKTSQLLSFDFPSYTNDPYAKSVFTTWQVTLDKIQSDPLGESALEILNIMAYLSPDNISNTLFLKLENVNLDLASALHLLKSYSMISAGSQRDKSTIHRLVQQVVRINLEMDPNKLREIVRKTEKLVMDYEGDVENRFHYLHFLLYMTEHAELRSILKIDFTSRELFRILPYHDTKYWLYFLDLAYIKFLKEKYLKFLGEALIYYSKIPSLLFLSQTLFYIEKKLAEGALSKENIKYILERRYYPQNPYFRLLTYLPVPPHIREQQRFAIELIYSLREKLFKDKKEYLLCVAHPLKKRSVNQLCHLSETDRRHDEETDKLVIDTHLKNVVRLSDWISSGLLTKDILSALLQGEFNTVAIDFSLIGGSIFLGKISNKLLTQGSLLADNSFTFTKDLALENKSVLKIFLDKEVLIAAKSHFLGQAMKTASPFVARGTVLLFAYNLINEIEEYKEGNKLLLPEIIADGVIVGIEGVEAGIEASEFLGFIAGVSEFTGPIGAGAVALVWFGMESYHAKKQLEVIETQVHLGLVEKLKQSLRAFFHFAPSEYLEVKAANNQLLEKALSFLKNHTEIKRYIFPAFSSLDALYEKNEVFLEQKRKFIVSDSMPDNPQEGGLFCLSGDTSDSITHWLESETNMYLCKNAIGLEYSVNRTANITFANLKEGDDEMLTSFDSPTLFLVEAGNKKYKGGDNGNLFILQGGSITGLVQGGNGTDTILLNDFSSQGDYVLHDSRGFLCGKNNRDDLYNQLYCQTDALEVKDIEQIYGKKDTMDIFYVSEYTDFIDGYGGKNKDFPDYFYITPTSNKNPKLVLRNNTQVLSFLDSGVNSISYRVPALGGGEARVRFSFTETTQHQFFFDFSLTEIQTITVVNAIIRFDLALRTAKNFSKEIFSITISDPYPNTNRGLGNNITVVPQQACYFFQGIEIKLLNKDHIYAREYDNKDNRKIDERINSFIKLAQRLGKTLSIQLMDYKSVFVGQKKYEVFYTNDDTENYLVGNVIGNSNDNEDENIYVVSAANATFPLPKIVIYDSVHENLGDFEMLTDTLDLRKVVVKANQLWPNCTITPHVSHRGHDLIIKVAAETPYLQLTSIILKNALLDNWYQKLNVILDTIPRSIKTNNGTWRLETIPLTFDSDKEIIVLTHQNVETNAEIFVLKKIGNYLFFRDKTNLIITNLFSDPYDRCTIVCKQYYANQMMQKKILSATFNFFDQSLEMQQHLTEINNATQFSEVYERNITGFPLDRLDVASNHSLSKRSIDAALAHKFQTSAANSAPRTLSPVQYVFNWLKESSIAFSATIKQFCAEFFQKKEYFTTTEDQFPEKKENATLSQHFIHQELDKKSFLFDEYTTLDSHQKNNNKLNKSTFTQVTAQFDLNGTLMLSHLIAQSFFNKKATNTATSTKKTVNSEHFKPSKIAENALINHAEVYQRFNISNI